MRVSIDDERCKGHGMCCGLSPQLFELTEHGYAVVLMAEVPAELEDVASSAAQMCPEIAISIEE
jgi:ferredoxin